MYAPTWKTSSDVLRRRLQKQQQQSSLWERLRELFEREPDPFEGIAHVPTMTRYIHNLRPWDSKPSEHYKEVLRLRTWWYDHPPPVWHMLVFLVLLVAANLVIAFAPIACNYDNFYSLWADSLKKPSFVYEGAFAAAFMWGLAHICSGLAPWFVYLTGGWVANKWSLLPYALLLLCETVIADVLFYARRLDLATLLCIACVFFCTVSIGTLGSVTRLSAGALLPLLGLFLYLTALMADMWSLNGGHYEPLVLDDV